jgi:hypothetical protein
MVCRSGFSPTGRRAETLVRSVLRALRHHRLPRSRAIFTREWFATGCRRAAAVTVIRRGLALL